MRLGEQPELEQRRDAVDQPAGDGVLLLALLVEDRNDVVEAGRPQGLDRRPALRIDASQFKRLLHRLAQGRRLTVAKSEHPLEHAADREDVLDGLRLAIFASRRKERVERNAAAAHVMNPQPLGADKGGVGIVVLEVENAHRTADLVHAIDQHAQCLGLARAGISGDEHAEVRKAGLFGIGRPVHDAAVALRARGRRSVPRADGARDARALVQAPQEQRPERARAFSLSTTGGT